MEYLHQVKVFHMGLQIINSSGEELIYIIISSKIIVEVDMSPYMQIEVPPLVGIYFRAKFGRILGCTIAVYELTLIYIRSFILLY